MALIAKRKVGMSWREAVAARARDGALGDGPVRAFERLCEDGHGEAEAAYRALGRFGLLWRVDLPGDPAATPGLAEPAGAHDVPAV